MKVLLTGAAGFIGTAIGAQLRARGHDVQGIDALIPQAHHETTSLPPGVLNRDVREADGWRDLLEGVDVVCHQAAMVGAGVTVADLPLYAGHNDLGTASLLAAMSAAGVDKLVLASSMVVYGEGIYSCDHHGVVEPGARARASLDSGEFENPCPVCARPLGWRLVDENARMDPRSSYAASKAAQEYYASSWVRQANASCVALRYHNVYGPHMPKDTPYSGVAAIFRSSLEAGKAPKVFEDGGQMRDFVHVDDIGAANVLAIEQVGSSAFDAFEAFNVCSGHPVSILKVAEILAEASGIAPQVTGQYRLGDVRHVVASPELAKDRLGFQASVSPRDGLTAFVDAPLR